MLLIFQGARGWWGWGRVNREETMIRSTMTIDEVRSREAAAADAARAAADELELAAKERARRSLLAVADLYRSQDPVTGARRR